MPPEMLHKRQTAVGRTVGYGRGVAANWKCVKVLPHCRKFCIYRFCCCCCVGEGGGRGTPAAISIPIWCCITRKFFKVMASLLLFPPLAAFGFAFEVCTTQKPQNLINVAPPAPRSSSFFPQQKRVAVEARLASQILGSDSSSATASALGVLSFSGGRSRLLVSFPVKSV